jgi:enoyl-CoA hydratase/carnithine racemase
MFVPKPALPAVSRSTNMSQSTSPLAIQNRLTLTEVTPAYWRVVIENPPINLYDPEMFAELNVLMDAIENDKELKVIVFESANPEYFIAPTMISYVARKSRTSLAPLNSLIGRGS